MNRAFLLLGSNLGNAKSHLDNARKALQHAVGPIVESSSIYATEAWGKKDQPDFLNQVIEITNNTNPQELLALVLKIESDLGRVRHEKWGARTIDIDILFIDDQIIQEDNLKVPHPEITNRKFTLIPLSEIAPDFVHPVFKKTILELLGECTDTLQVSKLT